jgi:hypothetical protein
MKGFLTFTLAAGVAITTTSVSAGGNVSKVAVTSKTPQSASAPATMSGLGLALDRMSLHRELDRLNSLLTPLTADTEGEVVSMPTTEKTGGANWTW